MQVLKEINAKSFIVNINKVRKQKDYGNQAIALGFRFAFHREFNGTEFFRSAKKDTIVDEELFILEVLGSNEFPLQDSIELLARFFCGIQVFEKLKGLGKNELQYLLQKDLSSYVTDEMLRNEIDYINQVAEVS